MYHHINCDIYSNDLTLMREHLEFIAQNFNVVLPSDELCRDRLNVCLTFDDGYYDFYHFVYPILKELKIEVILGVAVKFVAQSTLTDANERLKLKHNEIYEEENYKKFIPFCTFDELKEMSDSGLVKIASHSYSHQNLQDKNIDLELELVESKKILEDKLEIEIDSFIFPYGKYNGEVLKKTRENYRYIFRIGNAINRNFEGIDGLIYRVNGDNLKNPEELFGLKKTIQFKLKYLVKKYAIIDKKGNR